MNHPAAAMNYEPLTMNYNNIDKRKTAFVFELDNVLFPEKDYLYQVYYLFTNVLEYTDHIDAKRATDFMVNTYITEGKDVVFDRFQQAFAIDEKYRANFDHLLLTAKVPLKLLLYKNMLDLLQEIVIDRKKLFIVTNGNPQQQLNKIRQMEWHGLEKYLIAYFADEIAPKPEPDVIHEILKVHNLQRKEILMIENSETDRLCAEASGIDHFNIADFL